MRTLEAQTPAGWNPPTAWGARGYRHSPTPVRTPLTPLFVMVGGVLVMAVLGLVLSLVINRSRSTTPAPRWQLRTWEGGEGLRCGGQDRIRILDADVTIANGAAVTATGDCLVIIQRGVIRSPTGVVTTGSARVQLGVTLEVSEIGVDARDRSQVTINAPILGTSDEAVPRLGAPRGTRGSKRGASRSPRKPVWSSRITRSSCSADVSRAAAQASWPAATQSST